MVFFFFAHDEHIIDVHFHVLLNLLAEYLVYQFLVRGSCVLQTKRYDLVAVEPLADDEGCFFLIFLGYLYLVVPQKCVHEGKKFVPGC